MTIALIRHRTVPRDGNEESYSVVQHAIKLLFVLFGFIGSTNTIMYFSCFRAMYLCQSE